MVYYYLFVWADDTYICTQSIKNSQKPIDFQGPIAFIDFYHEIKSNLIEEINQNSGDFFLFEGPSMQGKSTFAISLYNDLLKKSKDTPYYIKSNSQKILPLYISLDSEEPKNIFKELNKCSWSNFLSIVKELKPQYDKIIFIIDNFQLFFKTKQTDILSIFRNMKDNKVDFIFISSANSILKEFR